MNRNTPAYQHQTHDTTLSKPMPSFNKYRYRLVKPDGTVFKDNLTSGAAFSMMMNFAELELKQEVIANY